MRAIATLLLALAALAPARARACSCGPIVAQRRLLLPEGPAPGDLVLRVMATGFSRAVRERLGAEYRLRDARGQLVPLDARVVATRVDLRPRRSLPRGEYVLESRFAYDAAGDRLDDDARLHGAGPVRVAWFPAATFRVGRAASSHARAVTLDDAHLTVRHGGGDCGPGMAVGLEFSVRRARPGDVAELEHRGHGVVATAVAAAGQLSASDLSCEADPFRVDYEPGDAFRVVIRDVRGAVRGSSEWHRFSETAARDAPPPPPGGLGAWERVTEVSARGLVEAGPPRCPHGFEETWRREVAENGAPWTYQERSSLATSGPDHWLAFGGDPWTFVHGDGTSDRRSTLALGGRAGVLSASPEGAVVVVRGRTPRLVAVTPRGRERWQRALPEGSTRHRLARSGDRLLVAWAQGQAGGPRHLGWSVVEAADGSVVGEVHQTTLAVERGTTEAPAVAAVGEGFLLVWTPARPRGSVTTLVVDRDGTAGSPRSFRLEGDGIPDLVAVNGGAALANAHRGRIRLTLLGPEGERRSAPLRVDGGGPSRLPRVAWDGELLGVAWETDRSGGAFVAAVGANGSVSGPLRLDRPGEGWAGTMGIAPVPGGFVASYGHDRGRATLVGLRCRDEPGPGGPARIAPLDAGQRRSPAAR